MPPATELNHLSKTYAKRGSPPLQAITDLNLTVPPGQVGAVLEGTRNIYWRLSAWQNLLYFGRLKGVGDGHCVNGWRGC